MSCLVRVNIVCNYCETIVEPAADDLVMGRRGVNPSHLLTDDGQDVYRDRLPAGWESWMGQDGDIYDACPRCAPTHSWA